MLFGKCTSYPINQCEDCCFGSPDSSDSVSILSTISNRSVESEARLNERSILDYFFEEEIEETGKSSEKISTIRENEVRLAQERLRTAIF